MCLLYSMVVSDLQKARFRSIAAIPFLDRRHLSSFTLMGYLISPRATVKAKPGAFVGTQERSRSNEYTYCQIALALNRSCVPTSLGKILVGECSALWAGGSDPEDASADVSMHTAHAGERATPCLQR